MKITEDAVWKYYGCPNEEWTAKCDSCRAKVFGGGGPVKECINCWKIEVWAKGTALRPSVTNLGDVAEKLCRIERGVVAKLSHNPILVVRSGIPQRGYPPLREDSLLMIYAQRIKERDHLVRVLAKVTDLVPSLLPVRRGCWLYDSTLGPWQDWFSVELDYPD